MIDLCYVNARVRSWKAQLLRPADFENLLALGEPGLVVEYLLQTPYRTTITEALVAGSLPTEVMDAALDADMQHCLDRFAKMLEGDAELWHCLLDSWDAQVLKTVLRGIQARRPPEEIVRSAGPGFRLHHDHLRELAAAADMMTVAECLQSWGMAWGKVLLRSLGGKQGAPDLQQIEYAVDCHRFECLAAPRLCSGSANARTVRKLLATEADIRNIFVCLMAAGGDRPPKLLPSGRLRRPWIRALQSAPTREAAIDILAVSPYRHVVDAALPLLGAPVRWSGLERLMDRVLLQQSRRAAAEDPLTIAVLFHYLRCKRNEVMNLRFIAYGLRNRLPANAIRALTLRPLEVGRQ